MSPTSPTYIALQPLGVLDLSPTSNMPVFDGMVGKPYISAFQNFFRIENPLNIKEVMKMNINNPQYNAVCTLGLNRVIDISDMVKVYDLKYILRKLRISASN